MKRSFTSFTAAVCTISLIACSSAPPAQTSSGPALYVAERGIAKVYIFGACGGGDGTWLTPRLKSALAESKEFWREIPTAPLDANSIAFSNKLGLRGQGSLFDDLTPDEAKRVMDMATPLGIDRSQLQTMKLWYAARVLTFAFYAKDGRPVTVTPGKSPEQSGNPELVMSALAAEQGKPVRAEYANWNDFALFFDRMSKTVQKQYLLYSLDDLEKGAGSERAAEIACAHGDISYFEKNVQDFSTRYPELYKALNGERDADWARRIDGFLAGGGSTFMLVGINHTIGPDSIQAELKKLRIKASRVN